MFRRDIRSVQCANLNEALKTLQKLRIKKKYIIQVTLRATLRKNGKGKYFCKSRLIRGVSKIYPRGIHVMNRWRVCNVMCNRERRSELVKTSKHNSKIGENSFIQYDFICCIFCDVISPIEKSNISSLYKMVNLSKKFWIHLTSSTSKYSCCFHKASHSFCCYSLGQEWKLANSSATLF